VVGGWVVVVVVVRTPTPNYLRQASQNLGKYSTSYANCQTNQLKAEETQNHNKHEVIR
jgi:hypothetical protein